MPLLVPYHQKMFSDSKCWAHFLAATPFFARSKNAPHWFKVYSGVGYILTNIQRIFILNSEQHWSYTNPTKFDQVIAKKLLPFFEMEDCCKSVIFYQIWENFVVLTLEISFKCDTPREKNKSVFKLFFQQKTRYRT